MTDNRARADFGFRISECGFKNRLKEARLSSFINPKSAFRVPQSKGCD